MIQILASLLYLFLFIHKRPFQLIKIYQEAIKEILHEKFEGGHIRLFKTFVIHSFLKQFLTDGANFLMTFTNVLPLKVQGKNR